MGRQGFLNASVILQANWLGGERGRVGKRETERIRIKRF
jgi:hypothetical protein